MSEEANVETLSKNLRQSHFSLGNFPSFFSLVFPFIIKQ